MDTIKDYEDILGSWYECEVDRDDLVKLMQRSNFRGIIQILGHFGLLLGFGFLAWYMIGSFWMFPAFFAYGTVYCFLNHVMHETHHRTPFKSNILNEFVHWISAWAHGAEPIFDRWGHAQHHTHTYFPQLDPESIGSRPVKLSSFFLPFIGVGIIKPFPIIKHALGIIDNYSRELVPETDWKKMIWSSRLWLLGYALIIAASLYYHSILPLVYTLFARFYGAFIPTMLNQTQHVGLEQNVYDHRLITRNVKLNPVLSFIYWNMEHHIEHHMFPGVPFYALSKLNVLVKDQLPAPYNNIWTAYKEIIPTIFRQQKDSDFHITPILPEDYKDGSKKGDHKEKTKSDNKNTSNAVIEGSTKWIPALEADNLSVNDIAPFKYEDTNYAIYRLEDGYYASSGKCTHAGAILAKGLVIDERIECPAHQGRFDIRSGKATHSPASDHLVTYPTRVQDGLVFIGLPKK